MIEKILIWILALWVFGYFFAFWFNPTIIKKILLNKGYGIEFIRTFLKQRYYMFYGWIPKFLLK